MKKSKLFILMSMFVFLVSCASTEKVSSAERKRNFAVLKTQLAVEFVNVKDYRSAVGAINEAINADSSYTYAWMVKGIVYQHMKDFPMAQSAYLKALSMNPENAEINNNYGWFICNDLKNPDKSLGYFDNALSDLTYPTPELAYMNKGICLAQIGQYTQAELNLNKAIMSNPNFAYSNAELSRLKYHQGRYTEAKRYFDVYQSSVANLRAKDLELGYQIASRLGNIKEQNNYSNELRIKYPYSEENLRLSH